MFSWSRLPPQCSEQYIQPGKPGTARFVRCHRQRRPFLLLQCVVDKQPHRVVRATPFFYSSCMMVAFLPLTGRTSILAQFHSNNFFLLLHSFCICFDVFQTEELINYVTYPKAAAACQRLEITGFGVQLQCFCCDLRQIVSIIFNQYVCQVSVVWKWMPGIGQQHRILKVWVRVLIPALFGKQIKSSGPWVPYSYNLAILSCLLLKTNMACI